MSALYRWLRPLHCLAAGSALIVLSPSFARAQAVVTALRVSRPAVVGRIAAAECTLENRGKSRVAVRAVAVEMKQTDGSSAPFTVTPPFGPVIKSLKPGERATIFRYQPVKTAGDFACAAVYTDGSGAKKALTFANGKPAVVTLHAITAASAPQAQYQITDAQPRHVYAPGQTIKLQVLPLYAAGANLASSVRAVEVTPGAKPWSMTDPAKARDMLLKPAGGDFGFETDFYNVPDDKKYLDVAVTFDHPVEMASFILSGMNLNGYYDLKTCDARAVAVDGGETPVRTIIIREGSRWSLRSALTRSATVAGLKLRLTSPYKINLTGLVLQGDPAPGAGSAALPRITYAWRDGFGKALTKPAALKLYENNTVTSPAKLPAGYYGLALEAHVPDADPLRREYGFAVLPTPASPEVRAAQTDPRFGMVHADLGDPYLPYDGVKTLATPFYDGNARKLDVKAWQDAIAERKKPGRTELPLICDEDWVSDGTKPVSEEQLARLKAKMEQYFRATPEVPAWELGLEENLGYRANRQSWRYMWPNLIAKARVVREAAKEAGSNVKLVYQVAERDAQTVDEFCKSGAAKQFDVLSLHPYAWPDFPAPEKWMPEYLGQVHASMTKAGTPLPIWFTEIGAPHDGNPGGFFGYPGIPAQVRGLDRAEYARYMVHCYLVGMKIGVEKQYWYNYRDGGNDPEYAEHHFALVDYAGYPKAGYVAYNVLAEMLRGRKLVKTSVVGGDVQVYRFAGKGADCVVAWTYPAATKTVSLRSLGIAGKPTVIRNLMGASVTASGGMVTLTSAPLYIVGR